MQSPVSSNQQIPDMCLQFIWRLAPAHGPTASIFSYELLILNSSINFIIYAISSTAFRKRLVKVSTNMAAAELVSVVDVLFSFYHLFLAVSSACLLRVLKKCCIEASMKLSTLI